MFVSTRMGLDHFIIAKALRFANAIISVSESIRCGSAFVVNVPPERLPLNQGFRLFSKSGFHGYPTFFDS